MKKILALVLAMVMVASMLSGCGGSPGDTGQPGEDGSPTYKLRLGTQEAEGIPLCDSAVRFAEKLEAATNGDIVVTTYPSGQLGDYEQMFEEVTLGTLDMAWISGPASFDQMMDIQGIPYLVENWDQAIELWGNRDGYIFNKFDEIFSNLGATLLGVTPGGFLGVGANSLGDLNTIFDPTVSQSVLIRHPSMEVAKMIVEALGFNGVSIPYSDLYASLQTGVADGWYGGGAALNYASFRDVIKYYADYRYLFEVFVMVMSSDVFDSMPAEYQELIMELAVEEQIQAFKDFQEFEEAGYQQLADYGIEVLYPTDEQMSSIAKHVRSTVYPQLNDLFGENVMAEISAQVESLSQ